MANAHIVKDPLPKGVVLTMAFDVIRGQVSLLLSLQVVSQAANDPAS